MSEEIKTDPEGVVFAPIAAQKVREFIDSSDKVEASEADAKNVYLRVAIQGGGCAGFQYRLALEESPSETDHVFSSEGEKIIIDPESLEYVKGATISYSDGLNGAGFEVINPRAKSACGCGNSFTMDDAGCDQGIY